MINNTYDSDVKTKYKYFVYAGKSVNESVVRWFKLPIQNRIIQAVGVRRRPDTSENAQRRVGMCIDEHTEYHSEISVRIQQLLRRRTDKNVIAATSGLHYWNKAA